MILTSMTKVIDILVIYQENGLPHEKVVELPGGLSNSDCLQFIRTDIWDSANIINLINLDNLNRQKAVHTGGTWNGFEGWRPQRRSDARPNFGGEASRPYGSSRSWGERPTGWYAGRSPRDWAKPWFGGFGSRPSRGSSRSSNGRSGGRGR